MTPSRAVAARVTAGVQGGAGARPGNATRRGSVEHDVSAPVSRALPLVALAAVLLAGGCAGSLRMTYENADLGARLAANRYLDLDRPQRASLAAGIARLHAWHRREALPGYADLLELTARRVETGLVREDVEEGLLAVRAHLRILSDRALAEAAPTLVTLEARNLARLEARFAAGNARHAKKYLAGDSADRLQVRAQRIAERFEYWLGDLDEAQRARIAAHVEAAPGLPPALFEHRQRRQQVLLATLRAHAGSDAVVAPLHPLVVDWEAQRAPAYAALLQAQEARFVDLVVELDRSLTPAQRTHAIERLREHASDLRALAARAL